MLLILCDFWDSTNSMFIMLQSHSWDEYPIILRFNWNENKIIFCIIHLNLLYNQQMAFLIVFVEIVHFYNIYCIARWTVVKEIWLEMTNSQHFIWYSLLHTLTWYFLGSAAMLSCNSFIRILNDQFFFQLLYLLFSLWIIC